MKNAFRLLFVAVLVLFTLTACAPLAASGTVRGLAGLPEEAKVLILSLITALLTTLFAWIATQFHIDLSGYVEPLALVVSGIVVTFIESQLQLIPPVFDSLVLSVIHILVLIATGGFMLLFYRKARARATRTLLKA